MRQDGHKLHFPWGEGPTPESANLDALALGCCEAGEFVIINWWPGFPADLGCRPAADP